MTASRTKTLLLGDWSRLVRDPVDVLRGAFIVGALIEVATGDVADAARLVLTVGLVLVPRALNMPRPFDLAFTLGMSAQAWGNVFGLFERLSWYDMLVHTLLPMLAAPTAYVALVRLGVLPDLKEAREQHHRLGIFLVTFFLGTGFEAVYEVYEFVADRVLGTNLVAGEVDTATDLIASAVGSMLGGALLVVWSIYGWSSVRRLPPRRVPL